MTQEIHQELSREETLEALKPYLSDLEVTPTGLFSNRELLDAFPSDLLLDVARIFEPQSKAQPFLMRIALSELAQHSLDYASRHLSDQEHPYRLWETQRDNIAHERAKLRLSMSEVEQKQEERLQGAIVSIIFRQEMLEALELGYLLPDNVEFVLPDC